MTKKIDEHEGKKYLRKIHSATRDKAPIEVDVYNVLEAFKVTCPARQQAIKKLLCTGTRGKGNELADLIGAEAAVARAIELEKDRMIDLIMEEKTPEKSCDVSMTFTPVNVPIKNYKWTVEIPVDKDPVMEKPAKEKPAKEKPAKEKK